MRTPLLIASDLHLSAADPAGIDRFLRFADGPCRDAASVLLAGDLFDVWVAPSQARDPELRRALDALRGLVTSGVEVGFIEGNRDFAASPALRDLGVRILGDTVVVEVAGRRVVATHGDLLCRSDRRYQAFRRIARSATVRHLLQALPAGLADGAGRAARAGSRIETSRKAYGDMGLDAHAVADLLRRTDADALVCGHVHWGRRHAVEVDGVVRDVVVLGAWDAGDASYARVADGPVGFVRFEA